MRILLIDDHDAFARGMRLLLEQEGYEVEWVRRAGDARAACAQQPFDLVISDLFLPDQEGTRLLGQLRSHFSGPVISCSAAADGEMISRTAGFDHHLGKPLQIDKVRSLVGRLCRQSIRHRSAEAEEGVSSRISP